MSRAPDSKRRVAGGLLLLVWLLGASLLGFSSAQAVTPTPVASPGASPTAQLPPAPTPRPSLPWHATGIVTLAGGQGNQIWPSLSDKTMVYSECKTGTCNIWSLDMVTRRAIPVSSSNKQQYMASTDGTTVVWSDARNAKSGDFSDMNNNIDIYGAKLSDRKEFVISKGSKAQLTPYISGNIVVWADYRDAKIADDPKAGKIYMYTLTTKKESIVSRGPAAQSSPVTNGKVIVWVDWRTVTDPNFPNTQLRMYDLATKRETVISRVVSPKFYPAIWGNLVVWSDWRKGDPNDADIYGYDISTGKEFLITGAPGSQVSPSIFSNLVVWADYRNSPDGQSNVNIYGYDLLTHQEFPITTGTGTQSSPRVSQHVVVWENNPTSDFENGDWDIQETILSQNEDSTPTPSPSVILPLPTVTANAVSTAEPVESPTPEATESTTPASFATEILPPTPTATTTPSADEPPRISMADFKALYDDPTKRPLIIDVRAADLYAQGHIKGAISFPETDVDARVSELPRDKLVVAYCQ